MEGWQIVGIQELERVDESGRLRKFQRVTILTREGWTLFHDFPAGPTTARDIEQYFDQKVSELRQLMR